MGEAKGPALGALLLPEQPLQEPWTRFGERCPAGMITGGDIAVDTDGRMNLGKDDAVEESPSLKDLRTRVAGMIPRVDLRMDLSELVLVTPLLQ